MGFFHCRSGFQLSLMSRRHAGCDGVLSRFHAKSQCNSMKSVWHNWGMAKPPVIEDKQIEHLIKATIAYSRVPVRDTALLLVLYGTALSVTELATITVGDYLAEGGSVRVTSSVRPSVAHNGEARPLYWSNKRIVAAIDAYLAWRVLHRQGRTIKRGIPRPGRRQPALPDGRRSTLLPNQTNSSIGPFELLLQFPGCVHLPAARERRDRRRERPIGKTHAGGQAPSQGL